jgi:hypothetical protein
MLHFAFQRLFLIAVLVFKRKFSSRDLGLSMVTYSFGVVIIPLCDYSWRIYSVPADLNANTVKLSVWE